MDIRIKTLRLHNFKGIADLTCNFDGDNATIEGSNGAGKSTIFDAFTWLLFGKDHNDQDQSHFDIKTIDPATGEPFHNLEHWVEAVLLVEGQDQTLKRTWIEDWSKRKGEAEKQLAGHKSYFFLNGLQLQTKREYDEVIAQWMNEGTFKLLTNPHYFIDSRFTSWQDRRKALLELVSNSEKRNSLKEEFKELFTAMHGEPMETFRRRLAQGKKLAKDAIEKAQNRIEAISDTLPEKVDVNHINKQIAEITESVNRHVQEQEDHIKSINEAIADINKANEAKHQKVAELDREVTSVRMKMSKLLKKATDICSVRAEEQRKASSDVEDIKRRLCREESIITSLKEDIENEQRRKAAKTKQMDELKAQYLELKNGTVEPGTCPTCGQPMPIEGAEEKKAARLRDIATEAQRVKTELASVNECLANLESELLRDMKERDAINEELRGAIANLDKILSEDAPTASELEEDARSTDEFKALAKQERELMMASQRVSCETISPNDLLQKVAIHQGTIREILSEQENLIAPYKEKLMQDKERARIEALIAETEANLAREADELATIERLELLALRYVKADTDAVNEGLLKIFKVARWKMTDSTLDGGIIECCEVTDDKGVPYRSMNDARKIQVGMDVIRVFSERRKCSAPIFIDNAESITQKEFATESQVIRLVVADTKGDIVIL